jgi:hypothetical protein
MDVNQREKEPDDEFKERIKKLHQQIDSPFAAANIRCKIPRPPNNIILRCPLEEVKVKWAHHALRVFHLNIWIQRFGKVLGSVFRHQLTALLLWTAWKDG